MFRRGGQSVDFGDGLLERADDVGVGRFVETNVAVADLHETEICHFNTLGSSRDGRAENFGTEHAAGDGLQHACAGPRHAFEKTTPVNAVVCVIFVDVVRLRHQLANFANLIRFIFHTI